MRSLKYPRLVYEGGCQIWLKIQIDGVDHEIEVAPEVAWDWLISLPGWLKRIARM